MLALETQTQARHGHGGQLHSATHERQLRARTEGNMAAALARKPSHCVAWRPHLCLWDSDHREQSLAFTKRAVIQSVPSEKSWGSWTLNSLPDDNELSPVTTLSSHLLDTLSPSQHSLTIHTFLKEGWCSRCGDIIPLTLSHNPSEPYCHFCPKGTAQSDKVMLQITWHGSVKARICTQVFSLLTSLSFLCLAPECGETDRNRG